jgi:hypothetical protein
VNTEAFQVELLKLVLSLIMLEEGIQAKRYEEGEKPPRPPFIQATLIKFNPEYPLAEQGGACNRRLLNTVPPSTSPFFTGRRDQIYEREEGIFQKFFVLSPFSQWNGVGKTSFIAATASNFLMLGTVLRIRTGSTSFILYVFILFKTAVSIYTNVEMYYIF